MAEQLLKLIENIEEQNVQYIKNSIQQINKESLEQKFENGNTLLHYVFSCANKEIINLFASRLEELLDKSELSEKDFTALFSITNDGEFTPVDRILQNNAALKIEATLKGIHIPKLLSAFLEARGSDGYTISELIHEEQQPLFRAMKTGVLYVDNWKDQLSSFIGMSKTLNDKHNLVKSHITDEATGNVDYIEQNSESFGLNTLSRAIIKQIPVQAKKQADIGAKGAFSEANDAIAELRKVLISFKQVGSGSASRKLINTALTKLENDGWTPENIKVMEDAIAQARINYQQKVGALTELTNLQEKLNDLTKEIQLASPKGKAPIGDDEKKEEDVKDDAQQPPKQQTSYAATALKLGMVGYKLPQLVDDINYFAKDLGYKGLEKTVGEDNLQTAYSGTKLLSGVVIASVTKNPIPLIASALETEAGYEFVHNHIAGPITNHNQDYLDTLNAMVPLIATTALSFFYGGPVAGAISLVTQGTNLGLNYGITHNYISKENPIINWVVKPGLALTSQFANIIYNPLALLKIFEFTRLTREGHHYYKAYDASFKISDDQFPILQKYGYSATGMLDEILTSSQNNNDKVRKSYNEKISDFYKEHFSGKAKALHCSGKDITAELAKEASGIRNELKYIHHLATTFIGRVGIDLYKLWKYHTPLDPDYEYFHNKGKTDSDVFYASFKTDGDTLGLKNNGFDKITGLSKQLSSANIKDAHGQDVYPENIHGSAVECLENIGGDLNKIIEQCYSHFDFCPVDI